MSDGPSVALALLPQEYRQTASFLSRKSQQALYFLCLAWTILDFVFLCLSSFARAICSFLSPALVAGSFKFFSNESGGNRVPAQLRTRDSVTIPTNFFQCTLDFLIQTPSLSFRPFIGPRIQQLNNPSIQNKDGWLHWVFVRHTREMARPGALDDVGNQEEEAVREEKSASNSSRFVLQQSCYLKWSLSLLVSCCTFNVLQAVYFSSKVQCKLRQSDGDVILEDPQELLFHLPEGLTSQTHNLYWMLECLDFNWIIDCFTPHFLVLTENQQN